MIGSPFLAWLLDNLVWTSAALVLVLALRRPVAHLFGAGAAYALWLIPLCRLVAPPAEWLAAWIVTPLPSLPPLIVVDGGAGAAPPPLDGPGQWVPILLALWAGGAILFLAVQALRYRLFLLRLNPLADAGRHRGVRLVTSEAAEGPLALGLLRRRIVVPADFGARYTPEERRLALDHEAYHHRRYDILANHAALLVLALHWWNPLAWFAFRAFRADQELSCDAAIAAAATPGERSDYARALVKSASPPGLVSACPLNGADQLKRRLKMLRAHRRDRPRLLAGSAVVAVLAVTSLMSGTPGQAKDKSVSASPPAVIILASPAGAGRAVDPSTVARERRTVRIRRNAQGTISAEGLPPALAATLEHCRGSDGPVTADEVGFERSGQVLFCGDGVDSVASQLVALRGARERIAAGAQVSGDMQASMLRQIDAAIAARESE